MFKNREDAGQQLANALTKFKDKDTVVLTIPRGGIPVGAAVARFLNAPLDVVLSKKIGHPHNKEYAIGAVTLESMVISKAIGVTKGYIKEQTQLVREKLKERYKYYYKNRVPEKLENKTVIIVDDGVATGNTILITINLIAKQKPKQIIVAVPIGSFEAVENLKNAPGVDDVICLNIPGSFRSVGQFYQDFPQVSDKEALLLFEESTPKK